MKNGFLRGCKGLLAGAAVAAMVFSGAVAFGILPAATVYAAGDTYTVSVSSGYLALRSAPAYDASNEIGKLYSGDKVEVQQYTGGGYWWVYSPKYGRSGYVNKDYLYSSSAPVSYGNYTVSVSSGYLALRSAASYDEWNEIGELYSGDTVEVRDKSGDTYWWVYSPKYGCCGYVNRNYLLGAGSAPKTTPPAKKTYKIQVPAGYLALRSTMEFSKTNEIGRLYNGDTVELQEMSGDTYWYVYSAKLGKYGYVNKKYLSGTGGVPTNYICRLTVKVDKGYLALRTAAAYDASNEKGELYTGDTVYVMNNGGKNYWYVYSPKYDDYGYVNCSYLY